MPRPNVTPVPYRTLRVARAEPLTSLGTRARPAVSLLCATSMSIFMCSNTFLTVPICVFVENGPRD